MFLLLIRSNGLLSGGNELLMRWNDLSIVRMEFYIYPLPKLIMSSSQLIVRSHELIIFLHQLLILRKNYEYVNVKDMIIFWLQVLDRTWTKYKQMTLSITIEMPQST